MRALSLTEEAARVVEGDILHAVGVSLQRPFVVARLEIPHLDGGVLTGRDHQTVERVEKNLRRTGPASQNSYITKSSLAETTRL